MAYTLSLNELTFNTHNPTTTLPTLTTIAAVQASEEQITQTLKTLSLDPERALGDGARAIILRTTPENVTVSQALLSQLESLFHAQHHRLALPWTLGTVNLEATPDQKNGFMTRWQEALRILQPPPASCIPTYNPGGGAGEKVRVAAWNALVVNAVGKAIEGRIGQYIASFLETIARVCNVSSWTKLVARFNATVPSVLMNPILPCGSLEAAMSQIRRHITTAARAKTTEKDLTSIILWGVRASGKCLGATLEGGVWRVAGLYVIMGGLFGHAMDKVDRWVDEEH